MTDLPSTRGKGWRSTEKKEENCDYLRRTIRGIASGDKVERDVLVE